MLVRPLVRTLVRGFLQKRTQLKPDKLTRYWMAHIYTYQMLSKNEIYIYLTSSKRACHVRLSGAGLHA